MTTRSTALAGAAVLLLAACTSSTTGDGTATGGAPTVSPPTSAPRSTSLSAPVSTLPPPPTHPTSTVPTTSTAPRDRAQTLLAAMSEAERVGQLFMVDCPSTYVAPATVQAIQRDHVGAVILDGTNTLSVAQMQAVTGGLEDANPSAAKLFIATDQEGGLVQRLRGPGFSTIPSAVDQAGFGTGALRSSWQTWGAQLRAAGVNVDLAPVLDTVPAGIDNPPIGDLDRGYGSDPSTVRRMGTAVFQGLADADVDATVKHFPGLGRVTGNTDTTAGVTDTITTRHDAFLAPFAAAVQAQVPFVMISTAIYARIDPAQPAAFSPTVITGMLRGDLGYRGVVISDDLGNAAQVRGYSLSDRATAFIGAGGDIVLTVDATQTAVMTAAVLARAAANPTFARQVDEAALRVLEAKSAAGLLPH